MTRLRIPVGSPLQLLLLVCSFALAGYAGVRLLEGDWFGVALWFVGAALLHDLVLLPLYAALGPGPREGGGPTRGAGRCTSVSPPPSPRCSCSCGSR